MLREGGDNEIGGAAAPENDTTTIGTLSILNLMGNASPLFSFSTGPLPRKRHSFCFFDDKRKLSPMPKKRIDSKII